MGFLVDSCIILDIVTNDPVWAESSQKLLEKCDNEGNLYINPIIYTEISIGYSDVKLLNEVVEEMKLEWLDIPKEALFLTGKIFVKYRRNKGTKAHPLPDFYIGAHAQIAELQLITRDTARYKTYFSNVPLILPETK
jgi:hypothetical protein